MDRLLEVLVLALATWRLASLLAHEDGPFEMFGYIRAWLGVRYDECGNPYPTHWLSRGVMCLWCCSIWFGVFWAGLYFAWGDSWWLALPLALSSVAVVMEEYVSE